MTSYSTADIRANLAEILNHVAYGKERIELKRRGMSIAYVVPIEDIKALEALEDAQDLVDAKAAREDVRKNGAIPWAKVRAQLLPGKKKRA